jgi:triphosphatase
MVKRPSAAHEVEVKFSTDAAGLQLALASPLLGASPVFRVENLRSIYFDTAQADLLGHGIVLRSRSKGGKGAVLAIKSVGHGSNGPFHRREVEVQSPDLQPNLALFDLNTASELFSIVGSKPLLPRFETRVKRRTVAIKRGAGEIEIAFDEGKILVEAAEFPLIEVELELKKGGEAALYELALEFAREHPLQLDFVSKSEKGFRARDKTAAAAVFAEPVILGGAATVGEAVQVVLANTLSHFVANWAALRETDNPEAVHQMRVALRRMRAALSMFPIAGADSDGLQSEAKRMAAILAQARECDAFKAKAAQGPLSSKDCPPEQGTLPSVLEAHRKVAYVQARSLLEDKATTAFVLSLQGFLCSAANRSALAGGEILKQPMRKRASDCLRRLRSRVLKRGRRLGRISDKARHKLRIALKDYRYATEFLGGLFKRRGRIKASLCTISKLQDLLGAHNDAVMARKLLGELQASFDAPANVAAGFILGWYARDAPLADRDLLRQWRKFKRTPVFWD